MLPKYQRGFQLDFRQKEKKAGKQEEGWLTNTFRKQTIWGWIILLQILHV